MDLRLVAWGWEGMVEAPGSASLHPSGDRIEYRYTDLSGLIEWYVNSEQGLEQGFIVPSPSIPLPRMGDGAEE